MIRGIMGDEQLFSALKNYVEATKERGSVTRGDLLLHLDLFPMNGVAGASYATVHHLKGWIEQRGYPVLTLTRDYTTVTGSGSQNDITFSQARFLLPMGGNITTSSSSDSTTWHIPLTLTHGASTGASLTQQGAKHCWLISRTGRHQIP